MIALAPAWIVAMMLAGCDDGDLRMPLADGADDLRRVLAAGHVQDGGTCREAGIDIGLLAHDRDDGRDIDGT